MPFLSHAGSSIATLLALHFAPQTAAIQIDASRGPSCQTCTIELTRIASFGKLSDPESHAYTPSVAVDRRGRLFANDGDKSVVLVYDSTGKFLQIMGRKGQGPGEFADIKWIAIDHADSIYVVERNRIAIFSPSLRYVRSVAVQGRPFIFGFELVTPAHMVIAGPASTNIGRHSPMFLVRSDGSVRSLGDVSADAAAPCPTCGQRVLGRARTPGTFWSAPINWYRLEQWDTAGRLMRRIEIGGSPWYKSWTSLPDRYTPAYHLPVTTALALAEDSRGRVWVTSSGPVVNWKQWEVPRAAPNALGGAPRDRKVHTEVEKRIATIVEVFDPSTGRLVATQRFESRYIHLLSAGLAYSNREDADGDAVIDLYRVELKQR